MYEVKGEVVKVGELREISEKFKVRELVLRLPGEYPQVVSFQAANMKASLLDNVKPGAEVKVAFALRGRESSKDGRVFNTLDLRDLTVTTAAPVSAQGDDDIPF